MEENNNIDKYFENSFKKYTTQYNNIKILSKLIKKEKYIICKKCSELFIIDNIKLNFIIMVGQFRY